MKYELVAGTTERPALLARHISLAKAAGPGRRAIESVGAPAEVELSEESLQYAASVARRVHGRDAPVRWGLIRNIGSDDGVPPMAQLLRGGRGGAVRLKLLLSYLWFAAAPPHDVTYPARAWAHLLGLDDPEGNGARRIIDANLALAQRGLVELDRRRGRPTRVTLLSELGDGSPYELPGGTVERLQAAGSVGPEVYRHYYVKVPQALWTNGWIMIMSGPAVAMYLSLLAELSDKPEGSELWLAPAEAANRLRLSEDTRGKGLRELDDLGLVETKRRSINRDVFDFRRLRNVYVLQPDRLQKRPDE